MAVVFDIPNHSRNFSCSDSLTTSFDRCVSEEGQETYHNVSIINGDDVLEHFEVPRNGLVEGLCALIISIVFFRFIAFWSLKAHLTKDGTLDNALHGLDVNELKNTSPTKTKRSSGDKYLADKYTSNNQQESKLGNSHAIELTEV